MTRTSPPLMHGTPGSVTPVAANSCCAPYSLTSLPVDVLHLIRDAVHARTQAKPIQSVPRVENYIPRENVVRTRGQHPLCALSATCHAFRSICLPWLFRHIIVDGDAEAPFPPESTWPYICGLYYYRSEVGRDRRREHISSVRAMSALHEVHCYAWNSREVFIDNLDLPLAAPALDALYLKNIRLTNESVSTPHSVVPLRAFKMYFTDRFEDLATISGAELEDETRRLETVLDHSRLRMEEMVLPGEATRLSFLSRSPWPNLRILVLCGASPSLDVPFHGILRAMPRLESLTLSVAPRQGTSPLVVGPPGVDPLLDLRNLHHFAIAFPTETDMIFAHLTSALRTLALRDMPRYYSRKVQLRRTQTSPLSSYAAPILSYTGMARLINILDGTYLERLEVVVREDDTEARSLACVARCCPNLRFFELHRYRSNPNEWDDLSVVPVKHIAQCLSVFSSLHTLRVQLDFPLGQAGFNFYRDFEEWKRLDRFIDDQAQTIVDSLPWLQSVAILYAHSSGATAWRTWTVYHEDGSKATPVLDPYDPNSSEETWL